jgi:phage terminase large subunit-like protein
MLCKKSIVRDYGQLFPLSTKKEDLARRSLSDFETTNGVRVASKSLWQTLRGANTYDMDDEISARPTLLIMDDIDVTKSVNNIDIINANERKIRGETMWALDPLRRKIIFLWNVINEDWIVPRFMNDYKDSSSWNMFFQPLFDEKNNNVRPEVFTQDKVDTIMEDWKTAYNQNYLLIPSQIGSGAFVRDYFDYFLESHFEQEDGILKKHDLEVGIFIDPAFSTSKKSDDATVFGIGEHKISKAYYFLDWYADTSAPSRSISACIKMHADMVANGYEPSFISVEDVKINKDQTQFIKQLKDELVRFQINIPVYTYQPKKSKNIRIKDNLEWVMSQKWVKFNRNIKQPWLLNKIETQFLEFPHGNHDDCIDTISQAVEVFRKRNPVARVMPTQQKEVRSAITNRPMKERIMSRFKPPTRSHVKVSWITGKPI